MPFLRALGALLLIAVGAGAAWFAIDALRRPSDGIDLGAPADRTTAARLAALDGAACRAALDRAGISYRPVSTRAGAGICAIADGVSWSSGGARVLRYAPARAPLACPLAAALALWEWDVVQPAAIALFGGPIVEVEHLGTYACRRRYRRAEGVWSGHATAHAIDVAGFRLANGRRITIAQDWTGNGTEARFLRRVRDGGCGLFSVTLSPDYNAAHRDHLHLEEAEPFEGVCR